jgi:putative endopeptidase
MLHVVSPCDDFYQYAYGAWLDANPIPKEKAAWGRSDELGERNTATLHEILEKARSSEAAGDVTGTQIGDYYEACMNTDFACQAGQAMVRTPVCRVW